MSDRKNKRSLSDIVTVIAIAGAIILLYIPSAFIPASYVGEDILAVMKKTVIATLVSDAAAILCCLFLVYRVIREVAALLRSRRSLKELENSFSDRERAVLQMPHFGRNIAVSLIICSFFLIVLAESVIHVFVSSHVIMSTGEQDYGVKHTVEVLRSIVLDEQEGKAVTAELKGVELHSSTVFISGSDTSRGRYKRYCWLTDNSGRSLPIGLADFSDILSETEKYSEGRYIVRVEYYEHSGLIKSYSVESSRWEVEEYPLTDVEISIDDDLTLHRPADMSEYGDIAWVIKCNGEMLTLGSSREIHYFSINANNHDSLALAEHKALFKKKPGNYTAQLVKVFRYKDPETGLYTDFETAPISNELSFTVDDSGKISNQ